MAELNEEGTHIRGSGHWTAYFFEGIWMLWYGPYPLWEGVGVHTEQVKELVDLLNRDAARDSLITNMLCYAFDVDGPLAT